MSKQKDPKIDKRIKELMYRTAEIFNMDAEDTKQLFGPRKTTVTMLDRKADGIISKGLSTGQLSRIPWSSDSYIIESERADFTHSKEAELRYVYFQNASSLLPVLALNLKPHESVLDMCAAPGGKTIQMSKSSECKAVITVNDESRTRVSIMKSLFTRYGVSIKDFYIQPAQYLSKHLQPESFDKILLDAPCSGEGQINLLKPATLRYWSTKKIKRLSKLQKMIVLQAYNLLKPGGILVYSTCTLAPEENEEVIDWAVKKLSLATQPLGLAEKISATQKGLQSWQGKSLSSECSNCIRIKPNEYMEPFFTCQLVKGDQGK